MATKNFMTLDNLSTYHGLIKEYIGAEDAKSLKTMTVSGNTVSFFRTEDASGTAAYTVNLPDTSNFISKITSAAGSKVVASKADGTVEESALAISDVATKSYADTAASTAADGKDAAIQAAQDAADAAQGDVDALETYVGEIPVGATATDVVGYAAEVADAVADDLDALDQSLAAVAKSGDAEDVAYDNTTSELTSTNVQDAIDELAEASAGGVASKTIWGHDASSGQSDYAKVYKIYQGENDYVADRTDGKTNPELKLTINIPKDKVLSDASIVTITFSNNKLYDGSTDVTELIVGDGTPTAADAGKYLKMEMQNVTDPLYVNLQTFVDVYTVESSATQVQLALNDHEFSASIVAGSIGTTELGSKVVTTAKIADDAITGGQIADDAVGAEHIAITAHTESKTAGADGLAFSVTTTDGQVSAVSGSIAPNTYDAYGAASTVQTTVIGTSSDTAASDTINGAKAYADASTAAIATADIQALFTA